LHGETPSDGRERLWVFYIGPNWPALRFDTGACW
jgi:hypothetical protein